MTNPTAPKCPTAEWFASLTRDLNCATPVATAPHYYQTARATAPRTTGAK